MKRMLSYRTLLLSDWNMFWEYTTSVTGFINKCIDDVVTTVIIRTYQKPWITGNIRPDLKGRAATFKEP
jgi:hypothetical protein